MLIDNLKIEVRTASAPDEVAATVAIDYLITIENLEQLLELLEEIFALNDAIDCKIVAESSNNFNLKENEHGKEN
jgi:hypothetical protein